MSRSLPGPVTGFPLSVISPLSGRSKPAIRLSSVDLPQPEGPKSTTYSPSAMSRLIGFSASTVCSSISKDFVTFESRSFGCDAASLVRTADAPASVMRFAVDRLQVLFLQDFVQRLECEDAVEHRWFPEEEQLVRCLGRLV